MVLIRDRAGMKEIDGLSFRAVADGINVRQGADGLKFRQMADADLVPVMLVEEAGHAYPWTEGIFRDCMRTGYRCEVVELDAEIVAFSVLQIAVGEAHILNVCVHSRLRHRGVGSAVLTKLLDAAEHARAHSIFLEVRPSNKAALGLYEKFGFIEVGFRKQYYPSATGREDALLLAKELYFGAP